MDKAVGIRKLLGSAFWESAPTANTTTKTIKSAVQTATESDTQVINKAGADALKSYNTPIKTPETKTNELFEYRNPNRPKVNDAQSAEFIEKQKELNLAPSGRLLKTEAFRIPKDFIYIDEVVTNAIKSGKKIKIAHIGLGANGIEPLSHLAQIQLTAKKFGKSLDDVLDKATYIDLQKASDFQHRPEMLEKIEKEGVIYFRNFGNGLTKEDKKLVLDKFDDILQKSDSKYLGKSFEDFVDVTANHGQYDMVFCNNVFYYVGKGAKGTKYNYHGSKVMDVCSYNPRYAEVVTNLLSTLKPNGKLFFTHCPGITRQVQNSEYAELMEGIIKDKNLPFERISKEWNTVFQRKNQAL